MSELQLPPVFSLSTLDRNQDSFAAALTSARAGNAGDGAFFWSARQDQIDLSIVLEPEDSVEESLQVFYVATVAFGDALGALAPPVVAVHIGAPDRIEVNGAVAGGLRMELADVSAPDDLPGWLVLGLKLAVEADPADDSPGRTANRTTLFDEGCGEVTAAGLVESFARHFLSWVNRWHEEGFEPVRLAWLARARRGDQAAIDLDARGALRTGDGEVRAVTSLLDGPTWSL